MNRNLPTWNAREESSDQMRVLYKGKPFMVSRAEYTRKLTQEDHERAGCVDAPSSSNRPKRDTINPVETKKIEADLFSKLMATESKLSCGQPWSAKHATTKLEPVRNYTLEDAVESKETVLERPVRTVSSLERTDSQESNRKTVTPSAENLNSRNPQETVGTLSELKGKLVNLIDETIVQLESQQNLAKGATAGNAPMYPGGDGTRMIHRMQNLQLLQSDSFAQNKRDVRLKLFTEIETILMRLKDIEQLE